MTALAPLAPPVASISDVLAGMPGVVAVALGGSRATGTAGPRSDWDLGVYYRGALDTRALAPYGEVHPPGSWGRVMNGGAWLDYEGLRIDVLLRDLDVVDAFSRRALDGDYDVDALLGYIAGAPTYSVLAERALGIVVRGELPSVGPFPPRLAERATERWRFSARFSVMHARMRAAREDVMGTVGQMAKAITEQAHAVQCERRAWVLNEKGLLEAAGLARTYAWLRAVPEDAAGLTAWVDDLAAQL
jgi:hypothetical protein